MSADNWTVCPRCREDGLDNLAALEDHVAKLYGKVSVEDFDAERARLEVLRSTEIPEEFREDYEFYGAEEGEVHATYKGACQKCGLKVSLQTSKRFWPEVSE